MAVRFCATHDDRSPVAPGRFVAEAEDYLSAIVRLQEHASYFNAV
jgi:hypothetical protein